MAWRSLSFLAVAGFACGPQASPPDPGPSPEGARLARAVCGAITRCGCAQDFASEEGCAAAYGDAFDEILKRGLKVDADGLDAVVRTFETNDCGADALAVWGVFLGDGREGDECTGVAVGNVARGSNCGNGFACNPVEGRCIDAGEGGILDPGPEKSEGDPCDPTGSSCQRCDLYCAADGVCRVRGAVGEPCTRDSCRIGGGFGCGDVDEYLYCEGISIAETGSCTALPKIGEPCPPLDSAACGQSTERGYCDPASSTCVAEPDPWICGATLGGP